MDFAKILSVPVTPVPSLGRVAQGNLCAGCGACAGLFPERVRMVTSPPGFFRPEQTGELSTQEDWIVSAICPGLGQTVEAGDRADDVLWGPFLQMRAGWACDPDIRYAGASGGGLSALLVHLLADGIVDAVVQTAADPAMPIGNVTVVSVDAAGVLAAAGSRYAASAPLADLSELLSDKRRFAFVGKPCDVAALRALIGVNPEVGRVFPVLLSFFCAGVPSHAGARDLLRSLDVKESETLSFRYRGNGWPGRATAVLADGTQRSLSYHESWGGILSKHLQHRCKICADGTGVAADIVCADAWDSDDNGYPVFADAPGISLFLARTSLGEKLVAEAEAAGRIATTLFNPSRLAAIQPGQRERRRALLARLVGLRIMGKRVPHYAGLHLLAAARQNPLRRNLMNFAGMVRRVIRGRI